MAKKKDGPIQWDIQSDEEWQELLKKDGLWVVDVYRDWSGPCLCIQSMLKRIKTEIEDDILQFAMAPADRIEGLAPFRETCEPQWLFVAGGQFVAFTKGTNVVALVDLIKSEVTQERAVIAGKTARRVLKNVKSLTKVPKSILDLEREDIETRKLHMSNLSKVRDIARTKLLAKELLNRSFTIAIIKPDAVQAGTTNEILHELRDLGFRVLHQKERILTDDDIAELYRTEKTYNYTTVGLPRSMSSGPSIVMILISPMEEDVIQKFRAVLGPPSISLAKRDFPDSLRAKYGTEGYINGLHGSQTRQLAERELALFFPHIAEEMHADGALSFKPVSEFIEYSLFIIRPHALVTYNKDIILRALERVNLQVLAEKSVTFNADLLRDFHHYNPNPRLVEVMLSGPAYLIVIQGSNLYSGRLAQILGPENVAEAKKNKENSLRALYSKEEKWPSAFHVSENQEIAAHEVSLFFPALFNELQQVRNIQTKKSRIDIQKSYTRLTALQQIIVVLAPKTIKVHDAEKIVNCFKDNQYTIYAQKFATLSHDQTTKFLQPYNDLYVYPRMIKDLTSGPALILCILCEDAISRLKEFLGPWDPVKARRYAPKSMRSVFATDEVSPIFMTEKPESLISDVKMFFPEVMLHRSRLAITAFPQHCLVILTPDIVKKFTKETIYQLFEEDEIPIVLQKSEKLSQKLIEELYFIHKTDIVWARTMKILLSGEALILAVYLSDAVRQVNDAMEHGRMSILKLSDKDAIHVRISFDVNEGRKEMEIFFPKETIVAIIKPDALANYKEKILQMIANVGLLIVGQSIEKLSEEQCTLFYKHLSKAPYFQQMIQQMTKCKVLLLALSGYVASTAWKQLMGPTDPEVAKVESPKSIRALFGKDIIENAVDICYDPRILEKLYVTPAQRPASLAAITPATSITVPT